jgi:hypothetical protein
MKFTPNKQGMSSYPLPFLPFGTSEGSDGGRAGGEAGKAGESGLPGGLRRRGAVAEVGQQGFSFA